MIAEVIGVKTAINSGAQGLGFALPHETARRMSNQLLTKGRADHPYVGVRMAELTPEIRAEINQSNLGFKVNQDRGVLIIEVLPNSPAARAGLRAGDLVKSIDGVPIENADQVQDQVEQVTLGDILEMQVERNGQLQMSRIKPSELPTEATS